MKLVGIGKNVLINPERISSMEEVQVGANSAIKIYIEGREYFLSIPLEDFMRQLKGTEMENHKDFFAG